MVTSIDLGPKDILVVTVPVAGMTLARSNSFLHETKGMIRELIGAEQPLLIMPSQGVDTTMCVLKR